MIKYRPVRSSISASIKEEETFSTMEDMLHFLHDRWSRIYAFIGSVVPFQPEEILIGESEGYDQLTGYRNVRRIRVARTGHCIGYCGEMEV